MSCNTQQGASRGNAIDFYLFWFPLWISVGTRATLRFFVVLFRPSRQLVW